MIKMRRLQNLQSSKRLTLLRCATVKLPANTPSLKNQHRVSASEGLRDRSKDWLALRHSD